MKESTHNAEMGTAQVSRRLSSREKLIKENEERLKQAQDILEIHEGTRVSSCSMSYELGYFQGRIDLLRALKGVIR